MAYTSTNRPLKIVVCGPIKGGKTSIANFVAGHTEQLGNSNISYEATVGVRILECDKQPSITGGKVPVEIWDVSGDHNFDACWPAIMKDSDGVILVYNPEIPTHETEIGIWHEHFVRRPDLPNECCQVFAHRASPTPAPRSRLPPKLSSVGNVVYSNFTSVAQVVAAFEDFLSGVHHRASLESSRRK